MAVTTDSAVLLEDSCEFLDGWWWLYNTKLVLVLQAAHADLFPIDYEDNFFIRATHGLDRSAAATRQHTADTTQPPSSCCNSMSMLLESGVNGQWQLSLTLHPTLLAASSRTSTLKQVHCAH